MLTSYIYTAYKNVSFWTLSAVKSLKSLLLSQTFTPQPAYQKAQKPRHHRHSERGNVFFTLFGAVAVVGVLGAGIMATMRGPLSTMVEVNLRERAKTEMSIAAKLIMLESTDSALPNSGDCDLDGFIEPLEYNASIPSLTGGGTFPATISTRQDPWGQDYGYCVWDAGGTVDDAGCGGGTQTRLEGDGSTSEGYPIIVIVSAGPDGTFQTSCGDVSGTQLTKGGDDLVQEYTYEYAVSATGGLWSIKSGTPTTATIDKDLEVTGGASFSNNVALGATAQLQLGAASLLLPDQNAVATCNGANDQILRRNTVSGDSIVQICDFTGTTTDWVTVGSIGAIWSRGTGDDVYYNDGTPQVGIGTTSPDDTLDIVGTLDVSSTAAIGGLLTAEAGLTSTAGTTTLGTTNISGVTTISNTLAVTNDVTITGSSNSGGGDSLTVNNSDSSKVFVVQHDGRVGIGDANPAEELDVAGDIVIEGAYMIDSYNVLASPNTTADTNIFVGNNAGNMGLTTTVDGNTIIGAGSATGIDGANNTILGQGSGTTLTTGTNNILIGQGIDVPLNTTSDYLNIGGAITGSLTTNSIEIGGDLTISGDDLVMATNTSGAILVADGSNFNPVVASGDAVIAADGTITIQDNAVDEPKLDISNSANGGDCLKFVGGALTWQACSGGGGGDGVGTDGFVDLSDTPNAYAGAAADANKLVVVNAAGDGLEFVDAATAAGEKDRIKDATDPTDTYIDVDTTDDGLTNSTLFVNNGVTSMTISSAGAVTMAGTLAVAGDAAFDTNTLYVDVSANNVGFGTATPAATALIDMTSTTLGFLPPRMTLAERDLIGSGTPATGLLIFATDAGDAGLLQFYDGSDWVDVGGGGAEGGGLWTEISPTTIHYGTDNTVSVGVGTNNPLTTLDVNGGVRVGSVAGAAPAYMVLNSLANVDTSPADGDCLMYNSSSTNWEEGSCASAIADNSLDWDKLADSMTLDATTNIDMDDAFDFSFDTDTLFIDSDAKSIGIGTATPNANAALDVNGTNLGLLPPRNTDPAANITGTAGLMAYDSTDNTLQFYNGTAWQTLSTASGSLALNDLTDVFHDTSTDFDADTTDDDDNLFIGHLGASLTGTADPNKGARNTAIGATALDAVTEGDVNVAIGYDAGSALTTGFGNVFVGANAGRLMTTNSSIVAVGATAGRNIGSFSSVMGYQAGAFASGGSATYIGYKSGESAGTATDSTAVGKDTLMFVTGNNNVALGGGAAIGVSGSSTAANSVFIGRHAGNAITTGNNNIFMGFQAGNVVTEGASNIIIGYDIDPSGATASNELNIGDVILGNLSTDQVGIGVTDATAIDANAALEVTGTNLGFLPPRNTDPAGNITGTAGLIAYDSGDNQLQYYNGTSWVALTAASASDRIQDVGNNTHIDVDTAGDGSADTIVFTTNNATAMTINSSGNIQIGSGASLSGSSDNPLNVTANTGFSGTTGTALSSTLIRTLTGGNTGYSALQNMALIGSNSQSVTQDMIGFENDITFLPVAATYSHVYGIKNSMETNNNITNAYVYYGSNPTKTSGAGPTNLYGLYLEDMTTGVTNNYAIYSAGGISYFADPIVIGATTPNANAALDVNGTNLGFLPPRNADPASNITGTAGLIAYDSGDNELQYYNGSGWVALTAAAASDRIQDVGNNTSIDVDTAGDGSADSIVFTNNTAETMRIAANGDVGIGNPTPTTSLDIHETDGANGGIYVSNSDSTKQSFIDLFTLRPDISKELGLDAGAKGWSITAFGNGNSPAQYANDLGILYINGTSFANWIMFDTSGSMILKDTSGPAHPNSKAILDLTSSTRGLLPPRNANPVGNITSPPAGLIAYDSGDNELQYYNGSTWVSLVTGGAASIAGDSLDFDKFTDTMALDASTSITADGTEVLSIVNTGTGNSFVVEDEASVDATPFVIDADGNVSMGADAEVTGDLTITGDDLIMGTNTDGAILVADGTNFNPVVASGDATIANTGAITIANDAVTTAKIIANAITPAKLSVAPIPTDDEKCLTFEFDTNNFAWQTCGGASSIADDGLDWDKFADSMTLDATTTIDMTAGDLNFDANTFVIDSSANYVGINTAAPLARLHINGTPGGNLDEEGIVFGDGDSGFSERFDDTIQVNIAGTSRWFFDATSIYTLTATAPAMRAQAAGSPQFTVKSGDTNTGMGLPAGGVEDTLALMTGGFERLFVDANGSVSIGSSNPDDSAILDLTSTSMGFLPPRLADPSAGITGEVAGLMAYDSTDNELQYYNGTSWISLTGGVGADSIDWDDITDTMVLDASTTIDMTAGDLNFDANTLFIDSSANSIGIGTAAPDANAALDVNGTNLGFLPPRNADPAGNITGTAGLIAYDSGDNQLQYYNGSTWVALTASGTASDDDLTNNTLADLSNVSANGADTQLLVRDATTWNPVTLSGDATIANTGAITIANNAVTTAKIIDSAVTTAKIANATILPADVNAVAAATGTEDEYCLTYEHGTTNFQWQTCGGTPAGANTEIQFNNSGVFGASSNFTWNGTTLAVTGNINFSGVVTDTSDRRLKTDITPLNADDIITRLTQIDTYSFRMKDDPAGRKEFGVMAQELETIFPELVHTADDEMGTKSVNYIGLIAPMIEATKTLKAENDALKSEIASIKTAQDDMLEKVNALSVHTGYNVEKAGYDKWIMLAMIMMLAGGMAGLLIRRKQA